MLKLLNKLIPYPFKIQELTIKFVPQDIWIGLYWCKAEEWEYGYYGSKHGCDTYYKFYLCLLPCMPIKLVIWK